MKRFFWCLLFLFATFSGPLVVPSGAVTFQSAIDVTTDVDYWRIGLPVDSFLTVDVFANLLPGGIADSTVYLFSGIDPATGGLVAFSDDRGVSGIGSDLDPFLDGEALLAGSYTLAIGSSLLFEEEARAGFNPLGLYSGLYNITFSALDALGAAVNITVAPVPEPGTMILLGAGLAGLVGLRLRKKFTWGNPTIGA